MYMYVCVCVCVCVYIYKHGHTPYIYIEGQKEGLCTFSSVPNLPPSQVSNQTSSSLCFVVVSKSSCNLSGNIVNNQYLNSSVLKH